MPACMPRHVFHRHMSIQPLHELVCHRGHPKRPPPGFLYGLPILIKELEAVQGVRWTCCSLVHKDRVADYSDPLVLQLEAMGGIIVGKTNSPEFGAGSNSFNDLFQSTTTPYDIRATAGGSSGGTAAALAAHQVWLATGSDYGGSLRTPAAFCGVVGFRLSPGRIPRPGVQYSGPPQPHAWCIHGVNGPMGRNISDICLFLDAMTLSPVDGELPHQTAGWEGYDCPAAPDDGFVSWQESAIRDPGQVRVAYSVLGCVHPELEELCRRAATLLASDGGTELDIHDAPFDLEKAASNFHVLRAAAFHQKFRCAQGHHFALTVLCSDATLHHEIAARCLLRTMRS